MRRVIVGALVVVAAVLAARAVLAPDTRGATVGHFRIDSRDVGRPLRVADVVPKGASAADPRPLLIFLHGRGGHGEDSNLGPALYAGLDALGAQAPVVVFPNGGVAGYWHDRRGARWASYVMDEVLPRALATLPVDPKRIAIGGISMGGFGALDIARTHPHRFCAVGAHSPALWRTGGETAPGAFDDAADFARHDLIGVARRDPARFAGQPLWLDAGTADPFDPGDRAFAAALRTGHVPVTVHRWPGGHDGSYWAAHWGQYLRFYAHACAAPPAG